MKIYNKLNFAIITILCTQNLYSVSIDPIQIQSSLGDLLYAEIHFQQTDAHTPIKVSLALPEDLQSVGVQHNPPQNLNFFVRKNNTGAGVITITSSKPMTNAGLNLVIKIHEGLNTRLQHIQEQLSNHRLSAKSQVVLSNLEKVLSPIMVVNEQEIALNQPIEKSIHTLSATSHIKNKITQNSVTQEQPLIIMAGSLPPTLNSLAEQPSPIPQNSIKILATSNSALIQPIIKQQTVATNQSHNYKNIIQNPLTTNTTQVSLIVNNLKDTATQNKIIKEQPLIILTSPPPILNNIVADSSITISTMRQNSLEVSTTNNLAPLQSTKNLITQNAQTIPVSNNDRPLLQNSAFQYTVQKNESLWIIASRVALEQKYSLSKIMAQIKVNNRHAFIQGNINKLKNGAVLNLNVQQSIPNEKNNILVKYDIKTTQKNLTKYSIKPPEKSLLIKHMQHNIQYTTSKSKTTSKGLPSTVITPINHLYSQKNRSQIELALNQNNPKILLLNTKQNLLP